MSSDTTASATEFRRLRGRGLGYRPDQVDRFLEELSEDRDAAWERAARLTGLAGEMDAECAELREQIAALAPQDFETLGSGAQELLRLVEEEAAAVRERAEAEAQYARDAAETARRILQDEARAVASARLAAAEDEAERTLDEACGRAAEILGEARTQAAAVRGEADRMLDLVRAEAVRGAAEAEAERRGRMGALEQELAAREEGVDGRLTGLLADAERRLDAARHERAAAAEALRMREGEAEQRAAAMLAQARVHEDRVRRDSERVLREHQERRDEIRAHLAHIRATLASLTGRDPRPPALDG
jgi:hypothetical protein